MGWLKNPKIEYLDNGTYFFYEIKKLLSVPQITHFEKLLFYSGGNLYIKTGQLICNPTGLTGFYKGVILI